jgi:hypothetical protein
MKKFITLAAVSIIIMQALPKQPIVIVANERVTHSAAWSLHDTVKLIIKKITNLDVTL